MTETPTTATTAGARDHARSMAGTVVAAMPTMPPSAATDLPADVDARDVLWDEVVPGGGYTARRLPRGAHVRIVDERGDGCAGVLLHRADQPSERLNVADTVKVQWQAYLREGQLLLSDMGRVLAAIVEDTSARHDTFCGTSTRGANDARYGDGAPDGPSPNGRDHFAVALNKLGLARRDIAPNINFFTGVRVEPDGTLRLDERPGPANAAVTLRLELGCLVSIVNVPHPLDPRPVYTVTPLRVLAWAGEPAAPDDQLRIATPEAERAYLNTEAEVLR